MGGRMPEKCEASEQSPGIWYPVPPCPGCGLDLGGEMGSNPMRYECQGCEVTFVGDASGLLTEVDGLFGRTQ